MHELFDQLGVNWKLLISQGANFFILLFVLTFFLWRPILRLLRERALKIEEGLRATDEAEERLRAIDRLREEKAIEADRKAFAVVAEAEARGIAKRDAIIENAEKLTDALLRRADEEAAHQRAAEEEKIMKHARGLVRDAIIRYVELKPEDIDEKLIHEALITLRNKQI